MFRNASGPLYEFLKDIGRDMNDCGLQTPFSSFSEIVRDSSTPVGMTENWIVAHLNELTDDDLDLLARSRKRFSIVHCPRSHEYFGHSPFQFDKLCEHGFNVCLGTDSLASNADLSLFGELRAFQKKFPNVSPEEVLKMVTVNGARALRQETVLGKIRSGFLADLVAVPCAGSTSALEEIVAFDRPVSWSMVGGQVQNSA